MKTSLRLTIAAQALLVFNVSAEMPAELDLQVYAARSITGPVGTVYLVEYVTDLAQTNNARACNAIGKVIADPKAVPRGTALQTLRENGTPCPSVAHSGRDRAVSGGVAMRQKP
jgi:hypothetical protein